MKLSLLVDLFPPEEIFHVKPLNKGNQLKMCNFLS